MEEGDSTRQVNPESTSFMGVDPERFPPPPGPGSLIDNKYRILSFIGAGGCGSVFLSEHVELNEKAAVKVLSEMNNARLATRFAQEAKFACRLNHPGIIRIFNYGMHAGHPYYAMEVVDGQSLKERLSQSGALPLSEALQIACAICEALNYAHAKGIMHRDIKPANIVLTRVKPGSREFPVKLLDFGIARAIDPDGSGQSLTVTGEIIGSPLYMSPEQSHGRSVDERSDIYSLGCTIFEMIAGAPPYRGKSVLGTIMLHNEGEIPLLSSRTDVKIPQALDNVLATCMAKKMEERFSSASELYEALYSILEEVSPQSRVKRSSPSPFRGAIPVPKHNLRVWLAGGAAGLLALSLLASSLYFVESRRSRLPTLKNTDATTGIVSVGSTKEDSDTLKKAEAEAPPVRIGEFLLNSEAVRRGEARHYVFPVSPKLGDFSICSPAGSSTELTLVHGRELFVPAGAYLKIKAYESLCDAPENFRGFPADGLEEIHLVKNLELAEVNAILKNIEHLTNLNVLDLQTTDADDSSLALLSGHKSLAWLDLRDTAVTGKGLAESPLCQHLTQLAVSDLKSDLPLFLSALKTSKLSSLTLCGCTLSNEDMKRLCQIPKLNGLCLRNCNIDEVKLNALAEAPNLVMLELRQSEVSPHCIPVLSKFKRAKQLSVGLTGAESWTEAQRKSLLAGVNRVIYQQ